MFVYIPAIGKQAKMVKIVYLIPLSGTLEAAQIMAERARVGNIFDTSRQNLIIIRNTDDGESSITVMSGLAKFDDLDDSSKERLKIQADATNPFLINGVALSSPKKYVALVSQSGAGDPTAVVMENTLGGTVVWTRSSAGVFVATLASVFTSNKTILFFSTGGNSNDKNMTIAYTSTSAITFTNADSVLSSTSIEIMVYP